MDTTWTGSVTGLLSAWQAGDEGALHRLLPQIYDQLRRVAAGQLGGGRPGLPFQTTSLVHEAYLRLIDQRDCRFKSRGHFLAIAAKVMRRALVDRARRRASRKRGGGAVRVPLDLAAEEVAHGRPDLVDLDEALSDLARIHPQLARMVEMRFFAGLGNREIAAALGLSPPTVTRRIRAARAWLYRRLARDGV